MRDPSKDGRAGEVRKGLGRGLAALLGEERTATVAEPARAPRELPIERLSPNQFQPRRHFDEAALDELAGSIGEKGILEPILVRPKAGKAGDYEIVAGERRWRAAQRAKLHVVPVVVLELSDADALEVAIIENVQREDLNPIDEALGYDELMRRFRYTQETLAQRIRKSRNHVAQCLRLLNLPDAVKTMVIDGRLTAGHARALVTARAPEDLARRIVDGNLTVRQAEAIAAEAKAGPGAAPPTKAGAKPPGTPRKDADTLALERDLSATLGLKVTIDPQGEGGTLTITYQRLEQLDLLCSKLSR